MITLAVIILGVAGCTIEEPDCVTPTQYIEVAR